MKAYYVAQLRITDHEKYAAVRAKFPDVFQKYNGTVLAADSKFEVIDGKYECNRVVIIEFSSAEELRRWYFSKEYQETVKMRKTAADANIILVHGIQN
jgi:uncharacterized protein (DUF1330 family)